MLPSAADSATLWRRTWIGAAVLVVAVLAAYANALRAPFVYDDTLAIPENPTIRTLWRLDEILRGPGGGVTTSGRPVLNLSFALNYGLSGREPWSYHVANAAIHAAAALLLFGIVRRTWLAAGRRAHGIPLTGRETEAAGIALAVAAMWALHPLQTQAVTYVAQRAESLMGLLYLLTLYAFARSVTNEETHPGRWRGVSIAACALGMGTKEVMATAPLMVLLYDRTFVAGTFRAAWHARKKLHLALAATWLVLAAALASTGGNRGGTVGLGTGLSWWAYPLTQFEALARYLGLSLWPDPLVFEYGTFWVRGADEVVPFAAIVLPLLALTIVALRRWPVAGFLGAWFFVILAPTSLAPGTIQMIVEHRMYLPLAAVVIAVVLGARAAIGARPAWAAIIASLALLTLTTRRNHDYRSNLALWHDTVTKRPENPRAHEGLAEALAAAGRKGEAIAARQEALRLGPDQPTYHYNLANELRDVGRIEEAVRLYHQALQLNPAEARAHNNLALLLEKLGRREEAQTHYAAAVALGGNDPLYHYNRGIALMRAGEVTRAIESYEAALQVRPDYADAHFNLGTALVRIGHMQAAIAHYEAAAAARPQDPEYGITLGGALLRVKRPADALSRFEQVLGAHPANVEARLGHANALAALQRGDEAVAEYRAVLRARPDHALAHFKLGNVLLDADRVAEAVTHFEAATKSAPTEAEAWHNLGIAFARLERWDEARVAFDEALRLKPSYGDAQRSREQLRQVTGK